MKVIRALRTIDFVVVVDHFMTDTADLAHLFLPSTTFLEEDDIVVSWGHNWIGPVNQAIEPRGEAKSDLRIAQELARHLGLEAEMAGTTREWLKRIFKPMESSGLSVERVMQGPARCPTAPSVAFEDGSFSTPSGKFEFIQDLSRRPEPRHPFRLLSVLGDRWLNSLLLKEEHPEHPRAILHPDAASRIGLIDRSMARIKSSSGSLTVEVRLSDRTRPDTVVIPHGTWIKRGGTANQLTEDLLSTSGDMAGYHSTTVTIEAS
jgi:anaerobic selenocysteine-containing dehydrogenase